MLDCVMEKRSRVRLISSSWMMQLSNREGPVKGGLLSTHLKEMRELGPVDGSERSVLGKGNSRGKN